MPHRRISGTGYAGAAPAEKYSVVLPKDWRGGGEIPGVLFCQGGGFDAHSFASVPTNTELFALADAGFPVAGADLNGIGSWGNNGGVDRLTDLWTLLKTFGCHPSEVIIYSASMGFVLASAWARAHEPNVLGIGSVVPAVDPDDIHDFDRGGLAAGIEAAYTNLAGWNAAEPTKNPVKNIAAHTFPVRLWCANDDDRCLLERAQALDATAPDCTITELGNVGHDVRAADDAQVVAWAKQVAA